MHSKQLFALATGLALVACNQADEDAPPNVVQTDIALTAFDTCGELESYLETEAIQEVNVHLDNLKNFRGSWWGGPPIFGGIDFAAETAADDGSSRSAPTDYTQTNTQVEGVDEADFVKTNGTHIFVLSGQKLYMAKSWPAEDMNMVDSIEIEGYPSEMFLDEAGNVVVFSYYHPEREANDLYWCHWGCGSQTMTKITVIDAAGDQLVPSHQIYMQGSYANARRIGGSIRVIMRDYLELPEGIRYYPENFDGDPRERRSAWNAAIEATKANNEALIRNQTLADWLPQHFYVDVNGSRVDMPRNCATFSRANVDVRLGVATIGTINLSQGGLSLSSASILGEVGEVYASQEALYIASPHWWWWPVDGQQNFTYFHKFDISNPSRAIYQASGVVEGYPLNQFAMDEHDGYFRVATTIDRWIHQGGTDPWNLALQTVNRVSVLEARSGLLRTVGQTPELAERERIQSARFMGDKAYLVTFEQIDPFFTLDMSNPRDPRIIGELKIPGFSSYLHPLDDDHILAIGVDLPEPDADGRVDWRQRAIKLTIFDVSNFSQPREKFTQLVGTAYGWSEAQWEHKAFNYFAARKMLAIPFSDFLPGTDGVEYWDSFVSDLRLFSIDVDTGITPRGKIGLNDVYRTYDYRDWSWSWSPWVRRSVMADDFAYAISDGGIRVANMANPEQTVSTVLFDGAQSRQ